MNKNSNIKRFCFYHLHVKNTAQDYYYSSISKLCDKHQLKGLSQSNLSKRMAVSDYFENNILYVRRSYVDRIKRK